METIIKKVYSKKFQEAYIKNPEAFVFDLRIGAYMDANLDINDWGAYTSDGELFCVAQTKEKLIEKVIMLATEGKIETEKKKWLGNRQEIKDE